MYIFALFYRIRNNSAKTSCSLLFWLSASPLYLYVGYMIFEPEVSLQSPSGADLGVDLNGHRSILIDDDDDLV